MKFLNVIFLFTSVILISSQALADIHLLKNDDYYCKKMLTGYTTYTEGYVNLEDFTVDAGLTIAEMQSELDKYVDHFNKSIDNHLETESVLCLGLYDDSKGPNAIAIGRSHIFFGVRLIKNLTLSNPSTAKDSISTILAHEFAHTLQNIRKENYNYVLPLLSTKIKELQADCITGALANDFSQVTLKQFYDSLELFNKIGAQHYIGSHGMSAQRQAAFALGFTQSNQSLVPMNMRNTNYYFNICNQKEISSMN